MRHQDHWTLSAAALAAPLLAVMPLQGCQGERPLTEPGAGPAVPPVPPAGPVATASPTVDQVKETPERYYGQQVRLTGEIDELYHSRAFELEGTAWAFDDNITVLTRTPVQFAGGELASDDELVVNGTVRRFVVAEIERDLGWDLAPELEVELRDRPVLVADSVRRVGDNATWRAEGAVEPVATVITIITAVDPGVLVGQNVDLGRERVQSVMGKGLWIGPSHMSQVFVLPEQMPQGIQAGDMVQVSGTLRKVPDGAAKKWNLPKEMSGVLREELLFIDAATVREAPPRDKPAA